MKYLISFITLDWSENLENDQDYQNYGIWKRYLYPCAILEMVARQNRITPMIESPSRARLTKNI